MLFDAIHPCCRYFDEVVKQFVAKPWAHVQAAVLQAAEKQQASNTQGGNQLALLGSAVEEANSSFLATWLPSFLSDRLFRMTQEVAARVLLGSEAPEANFPRLPGAHLPAKLTGTPALAFVRTLCEVLSLDERVSNEVRHHHACSDSE